MINIPPAERYRGRFRDSV